MYDRMIDLLKQLPSEKAKEIIETVFDEMLDTSSMTLEEKEYLASRRRQIEQGLREKRLRSKRVQIYHRVMPHPFPSAFPARQNASGRPA